MHRPSKYLAAAAAALGVLAASACSVSAANTAAGAPASGAPAGGGNVTFTFLTFETPNLNAAYWNAAIARTNAEVPGVTIKMEVAPNNTSTYLKQLFSSGQGPDIITSFSPGGFAQAGDLAPWSAQQLSSFQFPTAGAINGKVYALPFNTQPIPLVYYNKQDFAAAGIVAPPADYQEFLADCAKLKAHGITPIEIGGGGADTWADAFPLEGAVASDVLTAQPNWFVERTAGTVSFADPAFQTAAAQVKTLATDGYLDMAGLSRSYADTEQAFRNNDAAMYPMGSWFAASADSTRPSFGVGVFAWPSQNGKTVVPIVTGGGLMVNAHTPDLALAQKWALAFQLNKENLDQSVLKDGSMIAIKGYQPPAGTGAVYNATLGVYQQAVEQGTAVPAWINVSGDGSLPTNFTPDLYNAIADLLTGRQSPAQFGSYLNQEWAASTR